MEKISLAKKAIVGLGTTAGAMMFNTATSKFQGFTGAAWVDLH